MTASVRQRTCSFSKTRAKWFFTVKGLRLSLVTGGMLLEPEQVLAASATDELLKLGREWRQGPSVAPFMNLGMAISKGDSAGTIMVAGG
jgi:hypothetical protein